MGVVEGTEHTSFPLEEPCIGEVIVEEKYGEAAGTVRAEDEGLLDIGGLGGACDEGGEAFGGG